MFSEILPDRLGTKREGLKWEHDAAMLPQSFSPQRLDRPRDTQSSAPPRRLSLSALNIRG